MKILCVFGEHNYGDPSRGQGYEFSNFLPALRNLGHELAFFDSFSRSHYSNFAELNRSLLGKVDSFQPDMVFCVLMGYEVWSETLTLIRNSGARLVNWGTDDSWKYREFSRLVSPFFDLWVTTSYRAYEQAIRDGLGNFILSQWAAPTSALQEPLHATECCYNVSFVGSAYGNRKQWITELEQRGLKVDCFGYGWPSGPVRAEEITKIVRESVVSLNFGDSGLQIQGGRLVRSRQIKARVFEVPAAGGCLLTEEAAHLGNYYRIGDEILTFTSIDELATQIHRLVSSPTYRDQIAYAGHHRTRYEHTYERRFSEILTNLTFAKQRLSIDFKAFEVIAATHRYNGFEKRIRDLLVHPFEWLWGKKRGPRAARRLVFELCWRICGRKTYSASGLPGRWFYRES
jgi:hypothetical protein